MYQHFKLVQSYKFPHRSANLLCTEFPFAYRSLKQMEGTTLVLASSDREIGLSIQQKQLFYFNF